MGLDMYLSVRKYVSNYDWEVLNRVNNPEYDLLVQSANLEKYSSLSDKSGGANVEVVAVYWRKANAIHQWFVDNCAEGIDDCRPVYVSRDHLEELVKKITYVLEHRDEAENELPTQQGFFFGTPEYDEWYWEGLENTKRDLSKLLKVSEDDSDSISFIYEASW
jgi:hypothetical protein